MLNITVSADEHLIERAQAVAKARHTTLNSLFQDWLNSLAQSGERVREFEELMDDLGSRVSTGGRKSNREELNER